MSAVKITETELLAELAATMQRPGPEYALTANEIQDATGWGRDRILRVLKLFASAGRLNVHRVKRESILGIVTTVPAYTVAPAPKRKR